MKFRQVKELSRQQKIEIHQLWNNEYPIRLQHPSLSDFEIYLNKLTAPSHILLIGEDEKVKGWYFDFIRDSERWFVILLDARLHGKGWGTKLLNLAKDKEPELNGWVIDHNRDKKASGETYQSPLEFYRKNGFDVVSDVRLETDKVSVVKIKWKKLTVGYNEEKA